MDAKEAAQRYKIGKFILETRRVVGGKTWEDVDGSQVHTNGSGTVSDRIEGTKNKDEEKKRSSLIQRMRTNVRTYSPGFGMRR